MVTRWFACVPVADSMAIDVQSDLFPAKATNAPAMERVPQWAPATSPKWKTISGKKTLIILGVVAGALYLLAHLLVPSI